MIASNNIKASTVATFSSSTSYFSTVQAGFWHPYFEKTAQCPDELLVIQRLAVKKALVVFSYLRYLLLFCSLINVLSGSCANNIVLRWREKRVLWTFSTTYSFWTRPYIFWKLLASNIKAQSRVLRIYQNLQWSIPVYDRASHERKWFVKQEKHL